MMSVEIQGFFQSSSKCRIYVCLSKGGRNLNVIHTFKENIMSCHDSDGIYF